MRIREQLNALSNVAHQIVLDLITSEASKRAGFMVDKFEYTPASSSDKIPLEVCGAIHICQYPPNNSCVRLHPVWVLPVAGRNGTTATARASS